MIMNKNKNSRNGLIHLYNPKNEGLGRYDFHYINAYKKIHRDKDKDLREKKERKVA